MPIPDMLTDTPVSAPSQDLDLPFGRASGCYCRPSSYVISFPLYILLVDFMALKVLWQKATGAAILALSLDARPTANLETRLEVRVYLVFHPTAPLI